MVRKWLQFATRDSLVKEFYFVALASSLEAEMVVFSALIWKIVEGCDEESTKKIHNWESCMHWRSFDPKRHKDQHIRPFLISSAPLQSSLLQLAQRPQADSSLVDLSYRVSVYDSLKIRLAVVMIFSASSSHFYSNQRRGPRLFESVSVDNASLAATWLKLKFFGFSVTHSLVLGEEPQEISWL